MPSFFIYTAAPVIFFSSFFFFNDTATTEIYTLSLHDALPISLFENRIASLRRYRQRLADLLRALSVTERAAPIAPEFREALARELAASGDAERIQQRNRGEEYRQFVTCMLRKLDATLTSAERRETAPETAAYRTAGELVADLRTLEDRPVP